MKRKAAAVGCAAFMILGVAAPAFADSPGPGDKQCSPGQNSQKKPAQKGGSCPPKRHP